jgi:hypothetical protein
MQQSDEARPGLFGQFLITYRKAAEVFHLEEEVLFCLA